MNIKEIVPDTFGTLPHYFATAVPLTLVTIWVVIAFQSKYLFRNRPTSFWMRLMWPILVFRAMFGKKEEKPDEMLDLSVYMEMNPKTGRRY